jgi:hypothetical protein
MKDKVEKLIAEHKILKQEVWHQLEELNTAGGNKLSKAEKVALEHLKNCHRIEYGLRLNFITDLENLIND